MGSVQVVMPAVRTFLPISSRALPVCLDNLHHLLDVIHALYLRGETEHGRTIRRCRCTGN